MSAKHVHKEDKMKFPFEVGKDALAQNQGTLQELRDKKEAPGFESARSRKGEVRLVL